MGHASKERVLLIGTDQRITSGPAAKRLHSKAGYMAAPERFAKKSDSFPLHRGRRPYMALTAVRCGAQNSVVIGATADITGLEAAGGSIENDPVPT
jgi:hypothetical protein